MIQTILCRWVNADDVASGPAAGEFWSESNQRAHVDDVLTRRELPSLGGIVLSPSSVSAVVGDMSTVLSSSEDRLPGELVRERVSALALALPRVIAGMVYRGGDEGERLIDKDWMAEVQEIFLYITTNYLIV